MHMNGAQSGDGDAGVEALVSELVGVRQGTRHLADVGAWAISTVEEAYRVQAGVATRCGWFADGPPMYWKSGGASRDSALTHAPLPPCGVVHSAANLRDWPFVMRGIEAEIALRLGQAVDVDMASALDAAEARKLIDAMSVSIEIVDSRWQQGVKAPALLKLADLQSHGALVLGDWVPYRPVDWSQQRCCVSVGHQPEVVRCGTHSLGDPTWLLPQWLRHASAQYGALPAGSVVTTGTWVGILLAQAGDTVHVVFDCIDEASVQI